MKQVVHPLEDEHSDSEFAEKVELENQSRKKLYGTGTLACENC